MKFNKKKVYCGILLAYIFCTYGISVTLGKEIGSDSTNDLRKFPIDWINENMDDDIDNWDDLDKVYRSLNNNWDNTKACSKLSAAEYSNNNFIDIISIEIKNLDQTNATFVINVKGDPSDCDRIWVLYVWTNCSGNNDPWILIGVYIPAGIGGTEYMAYAGMYGDENVTGEMDAGDGKIEMDFPSDWYDETDDCALYIVFATPDDDDLSDYNNLFIDIYPGTPTKLNWFWFWLLLILILIAIAIVAYLLYRAKKKSTRNPKSKLGGR